MRRTTVALLLLGVALLVAQGAGSAVVGQGASHAPFDVSDPAATPVASVEPGSGGPSGCAPVEGVVPSTAPSVEACSPGPIACADAGSSADAPALEHLIGQKLVVTMAGTKPGRSLLRRVERGEVGGIVLLARNISVPSAVRRLTRQLQRAAARGGQPPLLIAIDQEGANVRRVPWAPPTMSAPEMGHIGRPRVARVQGARTGAALRRLGINVDLAPVADVPKSSASFMLQQGRTFSGDATRTTRLARAFAAGLASHGVLATMKHFPGIGLARLNTDRFVEVIGASRAALRPDLRPYRAAIRDGIPLIMLSNATYPAYDRQNAAGWSRAIAVRLLRDELGFSGVTITDSLNGTANARGTTVPRLALRAARAGTDMILVTGSERSSAYLYRTLLADARRGRIPMRALRESYDRIVALKDRWGRGSRSATPGDAARPDALSVAPQPVDVGMPAPSPGAPSTVPDCLP